MFRPPLMKLSLASVAVVRFAKQATMISIVPLGRSNNLESNPQKSMLGLSTNQHTCSFLLLGLLA